MKTFFQSGPKQDLGSKSICAPQTSMVQHCVVLVGLAALTASASLGVMSGTGTSVNPYLVQDFADLDTMGRGVYSDAATYRLVADIDAAPSVTAHGDSGFRPLVFSGVLHGHGHTISAMMIHRPGVSAGLFELLGPASLVDSLGIVGGTILGSHEVGGLVAKNYGGQIKYCYATNAVTGDTANSQVGGLVGVNTGSILGSYATGVVSGDSAIYGGGLVGVNVGPIQHSYATGTVLAGKILGGLVGKNSGEIDSCYATGALSVTYASARFGGLVGFSHQGHLHGCTAAGIVAATGDSVDVGGLVGYSMGDTIEFCQASGAVTATADHGKAAGLVGKSDSSTILSSQALGATTTTGIYSTAGGLVGAASKTFLDTVHCSGAVTSSGIHSISGGLMGEMSATTTLRVAYATGAVTSTGIQSISGGLVGVMSSTTKINMAYATGASTATGINSLSGGLVGKSNAGDTIRSVYATGAVTGTGTNAYVGGLVGQNGGALIEGFANGKLVITSSFLAGGLIGNDSGTMVNCYWDMESTGVLIGVGDGIPSGGAIGLTTAELAISAKFVGWNFATVWVLANGNVTPHLRAFDPITTSLQDQRMGDSASKIRWSLQGRVLTISGSQGLTRVTLLDVSGKVLARASGEGTFSLKRPNGPAMVVQISSAKEVQSFLVPAVR